MVTLYLYLFRFARTSSHVSDFKSPNKFLSAKLVQQGYWYNKLCKTFQILPKTLYFLNVDRKICQSEETFVTRYF